MILGGLQKTTLIDYPGKVAATVFTVGCSFRCPFCHNPELVLPGNGQRGAISEKEFFDFLKKRQNKLDGVCITGGEPTIQSDLIDFAEKIKELGFLVKLDSNGSRPDVLKKVFDKKLVDFVAMDIKNSPANYERACGTKVDIERIKLSVELIRKAGVDYEFRTTVVPGIHQEKDFEIVGRWLKGSQNYVLQSFQDQGKLLDENMRQKFVQGKKLDLEKIKVKLVTYIKKVEIR
ncbi:MAG: anaerobic ribonucleoside-triphosphate reductase activating protein [Candidatus Moranbacteria bacterium]|jgi:pyruvate formate lyase activating enzyme|nr:anaerobic ribonucleoside-triphosphate reductase activating protein [Candidatus Moranbacteria bacterium]